VAPGRTIAYEGANIDYIGLWEWLADTDDTAPGIQSLCDTATDEQAIIACVEANKGSGTPLFDRKIATSPRLAVIPILHQASFPTGSGYISFKRFQFVYIQGLYGSCDSKGVCDTEIVPNEKFTFKPNVDPVVVTAIPIPHSELDPEIVANFGAPRVVTYALSR
jgi:hypothetical protein